MKYGLYFPGVSSWGHFLSICLLCFLSNFRFQATITSSTHTVSIPQYIVDSAPKPLEVLGPCPVVLLSLPLCASLNCKDVCSLNNRKWTFPTEQRHGDQWTPCYCCQFELPYLRMVCENPFSGSLPLSRTHETVMGTWSWYISIFPSWVNRMNPHITHFFPMCHFLVPSNTAIPFWTLWVSGFSPSSSLEKIYHFH